MEGIENKWMIDYINKACKPTKSRAKQQKKNIRKPIYDYTKENDIIKNSKSIIIYYNEKNSNSEKRLKFIKKNDPDCYFKDFIHLSSYLYKLKNYQIRSIYIDYDVKDGQIIKDRYINETKYIKFITDDKSTLRQ